MEIIQNTAIREKYFAGYDRGRNPEEIIIHATGGGGTLKFMMDGARAEEYKQGIALFHYLITRDGKVTQIIDDMKTVFHSSSGKHDYQTIGIELENLKKDNSDPFTEAQYKSLTELVKILRGKYPIRLIRGHSRTCLLYSGKEKKPPACPGPSFNWSDLHAVTGGTLTNTEEIFFKGSAA